MIATECFQLVPQLISIITIIFVLMWEWEMWTGKMRRMSEREAGRDFVLWTTSESTDSVSFSLNVNDYTWRLSIWEAKSKQKILSISHFFLVPLKFRAGVLFEGNGRSVTLMHDWRYDPPGHERLKRASQHRLLLVDQRPNPKTVYCIKSKECFHFEWNRMERNRIRC